MCLAVAIWGAATGIKDWGRFLLPGPLHGEGGGHFDFAGKDVAHDAKAVAAAFHVKRHAGNEILMDESGNVRGVKASSSANTIVIYADSVVIASGGYSNNPALSTLLDPEKRDVMSIVFAGTTRVADRKSVV